MASISRTAYPRFKSHWTEQDLEYYFSPTEQELNFVDHQHRTHEQQLTLLILLKVHQFLGQTSPMHKIPNQIKQFIGSGIDSFVDIVPLEETEDNKKLFYRLRQSLRRFLKINPWSKGGKSIAEEAIEKAAYTMSDPSDLINVAIEALVVKRFELPAFSTLDRLSSHKRQEVNEIIYRQLTNGLTLVQRQNLNTLLEVQQEEWKSDFTRIKEYPGKNTLKNMRAWASRLDWLCSIIDPTPFIEGIAHTKVRQYASQVHQMELGDMKDIRQAQKCHALLLCFIHQAQVKTRDELINMFLRRMRATHKRAKDKMKALHDKHRAIEENMLAAFAQVVACASDDNEDVQLGEKVRKVLNEFGGTDILNQQYLQVSAYHSKNYLPLLWSVHSNHRAAIFGLLNLLEIEAATQDDLLLQAWQFIKQHRSTRRDYLPFDLNLDFLSQRWIAYVQTRFEGQLVLKRRELEVCVLSHLADAIGCNDLFVVGSQEHSDYRSQLLDLDECEKRLPEFCAALNLPSNAQEFVQELKKRLQTSAEHADSLFPENTDFSIDEQGNAHLKRTKAAAKPENHDRFQQNVRKRMPERDLLDILKNVQHWTDFTRHFTPPSGAEPKMNDAISRYLFTVFGYGCNLGAAQTAKHIQSGVSLRTLKRINDQHISIEKLEAALQDIINKYADMALPFAWGSGKSAIADGTHISLRENNFMGEHHFRYKEYGGVAYHHISDTYIALFCNFIACGVWEGVYILDALLQNKSKFQPNTVHADTQGQSEPVFGLAHLLGIKLMPRMRNWDDVTFYKANKKDVYSHIDSLFSEVIDWNLIQTHWKDMMQVALSIQAGKVLPSMLLKKLGTNSRKNKLYKAFRELGRAIRTTFLLEFISNKQLRLTIQAETSKIESFHAFHDWVTFGGHTITTGDPVEQAKRNKYIDLVGNIVMLHNVIDLTEVLHKMTEKGEPVTLELAKHLSPYLNGQIRRFGRYDLDMNDLPAPLQLPKLQFI